MIDGLMSRLCVSVCFSPQGSCTMGRIFLDHIGGTRLFSCANCDTILTNRAELISTRFTGATGRAFLFNKVPGTQPPSPFATGSSRASLERTACSSGDHTDQKDQGRLSQARADNTVVTAGILASHHACWHLFKKSHRYNVQNRKQLP